LLAGAQVHAQGYFWIARDIALTDEATAETDERGRFELTSLRTDVSHTVRLEADGFAVQRRLVPPGSEPVSDLGTIVMAWGGELLVAVISFEGLPVEGCLLALRPVAPGIEAEGASPDDEDSPRDVDIDAEAWPRDADITGTPPMVPTDSDGMASFDGLSAGAYQLEVRVDGGPPIRREVELLPPPGVTQVLVELPLEYMTIEGEVLRDGEPVPGVEIRVRGRTNRSTTSDSRGRFILAGNDSTVRWHSLRARWTDADGTVWATKVEIELDRPRFVRLELLPLAEDPDAR
jgi:hypothetical protein